MCSHLGDELHVPPVWQVMVVGPISLNSSLQVAVIVLPIGYQF